MAAGGPGFSGENDPPACKSTCRSGFPVPDLYDEQVPTNVFTLSPESVQWAIAELKKQSIHPYFLAYLILRRRALEEGSMEGFSVNWDHEIGPYLRVDGGGPTRPFYRPFLNQVVRDESRYWLNKNLAGSYAPSSIRKAAGEIAGGEGREYLLHPNHAATAAANLLSGKKINVYAFSIYLLRNRAFVTSHPAVSDVIQAFKKLFLFGPEYPESSSDYELFFSEAVESTPPYGDIFEAFDASFEPNGLVQCNMNLSISGGDVRNLTAVDLGIGYDPAAKTAHATNEPVPPLDGSDPLLREVLEAIRYHGGVLFTGPPGTSKSFMAALVANHISDGVTSRSRFVQMHASYQYEDFMEGYVPDPYNGGFKARKGHLVEMAEIAAADLDHSYVLVIDELSRADVGRVFGEALTYIEKSKRGLQFALPSGRTLVIPPNLFLIMTMNPLDKGVDEVDAAFERRFAKITFDPDAQTLVKLLEGNGLEDSLVRRVRAWFYDINGRAKDNPQASLGHAYFASVADADGLRRLWDHQLKYHVDRSFRFDAQSRKDTIEGWHKIFEGLDKGSENLAAEPLAGNIDAG